MTEKEIREDERKILRKAVERLTGSMDDLGDYTISRQAVLNLLDSEPGAETWHRRDLINESTE